MENPGFRDLKLTSITIVVFANRKDFCLTKVCIASIRFYYPEVEILIVKDKLNGNFNTRRLCKATNVKVIKLSKRYYGWGAAKIHFILSQHIPKKRYLCLDSDIIFLGRVLDKIETLPEKFIVSPDWQIEPLKKEVTELYIDIEKVTKYYPTYSYPGFFFNTGQFVATPGIIPPSYFDAAFDAGRYPYYKNRDVFALVDQAVLNAVLPVYCKEVNIDLGKADFMQWSVTFFADLKHQSFEFFRDGKYPFLVHYAGDTRTHLLKKMKGAEILQTFHAQYFSKLSSVEQQIDTMQDRFASVSGLSKLLYKINRLKIAASQIFPNLILQTKS